MIDIAAAGPKIELAERDLDQIDRQQRRRVAGAAAGQDEGLGIDVKTVHEAQKHMAIVSTRFILGSWI